MGCHFLLQEIFPVQGSNPCVLHWQVDSLLLNLPGKSLLEARIIIYLLPRTVKAHVCYFGIITYGCHYTKVFWLDNTIYGHSNDNSTGISLEREQVDPDRSFERSQGIVAQVLAKKLTYVILEKRLFQCLNPKKS